MCTGHGLVSVCAGQGLQEGAESHAAGPKGVHTPGGDAARPDPAAPFGSGPPQTPGMKPAGDKFGFAVLGSHLKQWLPLQNKSVKATEVSTRAACGTDTLVQGKSGTFSSSLYSPPPALGIF